MVRHVCFYKYVNDENTCKLNLLQVLLQVTSKNLKPQSSLDNWNSVENSMLHTGPYHLKEFDVKLQSSGSLAVHQLSVSSRSCSTKNTVFEWQVQYATCGHGWNFKDLCLWFRAQNVWKASNLVCVHHLLCVVCIATEISALIGFVYVSDKFVSSYHIASQEVLMEISANAI